MIKTNTEEIDELLKSINFRMNGTDWEWSAETRAALLNAKATALLAKVLSVTTSAQTGESIK